jgi:RimJ/RimL family protein N-acetyltransferase
VLRPDYPLRTARLILRPFAVGDLADLYAIQSLPEVARFLYWEPRDLDQARHALDAKVRQRELAEEGDNLALAVVCPGQGRVIGEINLRWLSRLHQQGEIGFVFHPDQQGRGFAREAAEVVLDLGFDRLGLHRVIGRCDARNEPSARLMRRLGMRLEARFVENELFKGEWGDELVYALLSPEWRARRPSRPAAAGPDAPATG